MRRSSRASATSSEATMWRNLRDEVAASAPDEEQEIITVWLIPTSGDQQRPGKLPKTNEPLPEGSGSNIQQDCFVLLGTRRL